MDSKNPILRGAVKQDGFAYNEGMNAYNQAAAGTQIMDQQTGGPYVGPDATRGASVRQQQLHDALRRFAVLERRETPPESLAISLG